MPRYGMKFHYGNERRSTYDLKTEGSEYDESFVVIKRYVSDPTVDIPDHMRQFAGLAIPKSEWQSFLGWIYGIAEAEGLEDE